MNPILPLQFYIPDVEARQWSDGRIYLYGSFDIAGRHDYCSERYHVFSSGNLVDWIDHGISFTTGRSHAKEAQYLYAPDCIYTGGKYHLLYCGEDGSEGIASSERPEGPFEPGQPVVGADGDGIDPAAFVDDDGAVYYFWGQFQLRGARLAEDLKSIDPSTLQKELLTEELHGFHEGASIRKRNGIYYLVYTDISRGRATSLAYATSKHPLGPYEKGGILIDNTGCDPETWNNHGSITEFNGDWYVFYHRSSHGSRYSRRVCAEPIHFQEDGSLAEVEMTSQGTEGPIDAATELPAYRACLLSGGLYLAVSQSGNAFEVLTNIHEGDWAAFKYLDFNDKLRQLELSVKGLSTSAQIEVRLDQPDGTLIAQGLIPDAGTAERSQQLPLPLLSAVSGVHALYLIFRGSEATFPDLVSLAFS